MRNKARWWCCATAAAAVTFCFAGGVAESPRTDAKTALPHYYESLRDEFSGVGAARFVFGADENAIGNAIEIGGGMERFFKVDANVTRREKSEAEAMPFRRVDSFEIAEKPGVYWDRSFRLVNTQPVRKGETLLPCFGPRA